MDFSISMSTEPQSTCVLNDGSDQAQNLATYTKLPLTTLGDSTASTIRYTLLWIENKLTLVDNHHQPKLHVSIDFTQGKSRHRLQFGGSHGQALARAVKTSSGACICDATAGLGSDAFVFASLECQVVLLERSAIVYSLLADALDRASNHPGTANIAQRMHLHHSDSLQLPGIWPLTDPPQTVYLDPMYPAGKRKAKKEMQVLRDLMGENSADEAMLLQSARDTARRVVVKRPRTAPPIANIAPSGTISSRNTRYDIYGS